MTDLFANVDITEARKALIAESYASHARVKQIASTARMINGLTDDEAELIEAHTSLADYAYLLAALLRITENQHGAAEARAMAAMFEAVRDVGTEVLEDANDDLDEQLRPSSHALDVATTPGCFKCGIPFEFDGPKAQEHGTTYCRACAETRPQTLSDIPDLAAYTYKVGERINFTGRGQSGKIVEIDRANAKPYLVRIDDGPEVRAAARDIMPDLPLGPKYVEAVDAR